MDGWWSSWTRCSPSGHGRAARVSGRTNPPGLRAAGIECVRMHSGMVRKCSDNDRGMLVDTESVALSTDIVPASSAQIGRLASTSRRAVQRMNEPVLHEPDRLSARCPEAQVSGEWDAPGQRTRNGVPTRPRIPRNGVVAEIIMVGPLSVSSWRSRPGRMFDRSRRVNTIGTAIRSATPFPENLRNCIPEHGGGRRTPKARYRMGTGPSCACDRTRPPRAPRRSPSGHRPRRRSARCHPR